MKFYARDFTFSFVPHAQPLIMGILNVTPDSFSDGNIYCAPEAAARHVHEMIADGAGIIDIGAESTRPGAPAVSAEEEMARLAPIMAKLSAITAIPLSIDTSKAVVAEECLRRGAAIINDIHGCKKDPAIVQVAKDYNAGLILMHMRGEPHTMHEYTDYDDIIADIIAELNESIAIACDAGVAFENIMIDPGIGFAKTVEQNIEIISRLHELTVLKRPILLGTSRKSFIGKSLNRDVTERLSGTLASVACGVANGANVVRVHDVREVHDFITMMERIKA
jgi:dihydropteroate synthase